jgi:DNA-binding GntR family transcriptional regulator
MAGPKIKHNSLSEEVYKQLIKRIISGYLPAGTSMREEKICKDLGVSRTPVRESLIRLVREGLLEQQPRRGCVVRELPEKEIADLLECRKLIECLVLRNCFHKLDRIAIAKLKQRIAAAEKYNMEKLREELLAVDEELHELIIDACENKFLAEYVEKLKLQCRPYRVMRCAEENDIPSILAERRKIIQAILDNDAYEAELGMAEHFEYSSRYYLTNNKS